MLKFIKDFWLIIGGYIMYATSYVLDRLELVMLQKVFYILSNILLLIGIWQVLMNKRRNRKIDNLIRMERTNNLVHFVSNPEHKGELIVNTFNILKIGGMKMKAFFKSRGLVQWISLVLTFVLIALGIATAFVPGLSVVTENFEAYLLALGLVAGPGILAQGKQIGDAVKNLLPAKERKAIECKIKEYQKKADALAKQYAPIIKIALDVKELGGRLTTDQQTQYDTYLAQEKALEAKIETERKKLEVRADEIV